VHPLQIRSVLVGTDLTAASDDVLRAAAVVAAAAGAALHVTHAFDLDVSAYSAFDTDVVGFPDRVERAEGRLTSQLARTLPAGFQPASREVVIYLAHRALLDRAEQVDADLIVLGPHRRDRGARLLGTTADRVIRSATCPCLIVRGTFALPLRRVVVPMDLSDPARGALSTAGDWIEGLGASSPDLSLPDVELDVVHVVPRLFASEGLPVNRAIIGPRMHDDVEAELLRHPFGLAVREELVWGETPGCGIVEYARERHADLIVMATHGRGALRRALVGSVASSVARDAGCPVLLVPPARWSEGGDAVEAVAAATA
jgi:nucleotide-binding universal stress UspA family protein